MAYNKGRNYKEEKQVTRVLENKQATEEEGGGGAGGEEGWGMGMEGG